MMGFVVGTKGMSMVLILVLALSAMMISWESRNTTLLHATPTTKLPVHETAPKARSSSIADGDLSNQMELTKRIHREHLLASALNISMLEREVLSAKQMEAMLAKKMEALKTRHEEEMRAAALTISRLERDIAELQHSKTITTTTTTNTAATTVTSSKTRNVTVGTMCRCDTGYRPVVFDPSPNVTLVMVVQDGSIATGAAKKRFFTRHSKCECRENEGEPTLDYYLMNVTTQFECVDQVSNSTMTWDSMPELSVEERLPLFLGVLSYKSPRSLNAALTNWNQVGLPSHVTGAYVQLNARSDYDDRVIAQHDLNFNFTVMGGPHENLHPGLAVARFCRAAEESPDGHPNGENLLLFLEKDWQFSPYGQRQLQQRQLLASANILAQRGVPYLRLGTRVSDPTHSWKCDAGGVQWECMTAHQQRFTNHPSIVRCDWFLRYMEPYALVQDPIMTSCNEERKRLNYIDWEEALQDGRVAWTNSQWVVANNLMECGPNNSGHCYLFDHVEVDQ
jgi:hypothetical protein